DHCPNQLVQDQRFTGTGRAFGRETGALIRLGDPCWRSWGSSSNGAENNAKPSSLLDSPGMGASSPLALELILDVNVSEVEIDRRRLEAVVAQDLLHRRQADPLSARPSWRTCAAAHAD